MGVQNICAEWDMILWPRGDTRQAVKGLAPASLRSASVATRIDRVARSTSGPIHIAAGGRLLRQLRAGKRRFIELSFLPLPSLFGGRFVGARTHYRRPP